MTHPLRNALLVLFALAIAGGLGFVAFRSDPVPVEIARVARAPLMVTVEVDGKTRIRDVYDVAAPMTGMARRSPVHVGDAVIAGETLVAAVDPAMPTLLDERSRSQALATVREAEAALRVTESQLREAEEQLAQAQADYDRTRALTERGVLPEIRLDESTRNLSIREAAEATARASLERAQGALDRARAALIEPGAAAGDDGSVEIRAPADGRVLSVDVVSAQPVVAGTRLLSIGDPTDLEIVADLLSTDAVRLPPEARAIVERWGGAPPLEARLKQIDPAARTKVSALGIEEQRVDAVFDLVSPPEQRAGLGAGFSVHLKIVEWEAQDVLQLPLSALFRVGADWHVFAVADGLVEERAVTLGRRSIDAAQVTGGLEEGTEVVLYPGDTLSAGTAVVPR